METKNMVHLWIQPNRPEDISQAEPNAKCGISMYPDVGSRPDYSENYEEVTCPNCLRAELLEVCNEANGLAELLGLYSREEIEEALRTD